MSNLHQANSSKELMIKAKNEAVAIGGDTLNNLVYGRKNNFVGETIFSEDDPGKGLPSMAVTLRMGSNYV